MYDRDLVRRLARQSQRAYLPDSGPGRLYSYGAAQALVTETDENLIIAFRGTEVDLGDWRTDFRFLKIPLVGCPGRWHRGFIHALGGLSLPLFNHAHRVGKPVILTGHSMGGSLAVVFAARLVFWGFPPVAVYTFGAPRACNLTAAMWLNEKLDNIHRFVVEGDRVPYLPPAWCGYKHVGKLHVLSPEGEETGTKARLRARLVQWFGRWTGFTPHRMSTYRAFL